MTRQLDPEGTLEVELYCRASTTTANAIDRYHSKLAALSNAGVVDDVTVTTWPTRVELSAGAESRVAGAYERFAGWADDEGVRLAPAFDVESYESELTGESGTALVTPVASIAVYDDGDLAVVYPHAADDEVVTVEDGIERLQTLSGAKPLGSDAPTTARLPD